MVVTTGGPRAFAPPPIGLQGCEVSRGKDPSIPTWWRAGLGRCRGKGMEERGATGVSPGIPSRPCCRQKAGSPTSQQGEPAVSAQSQS